VCDRGIQVMMGRDGLPGDLMAVLGKPEKISSADYADSADWINDVKIADVMNSTT
jgi:hypothetical protein